MMESPQKKLRRLEYKMEDQHKYCASLIILVRPNSPGILASHVPQPAETLPQTQAIAPVGHVGNTMKLLETKWQLK